MIVHRGYDNLKFRLPVVTPGIFDGVHRGHRFLIEMLVKYSREIYSESVVITYHPHPRLILESDASKLSFLTTIEEKISLLEGTGIDHLVIIDFTRDFSRMPAGEFISKILAGKVGTRHLIIGHDHHFGYRGEGSYEMVKEYAVSLGFSVERVGKFHSEGKAVSSSLIREALVKGEILTASDLLGYSYSITGTVVEGKKIGKKLNYPTANIKPAYEYKLVPGDGVYAVDVKIDNTVHHGMLNIGRNPTINKSGGERTIEVNILDFNKDIYGKGIEIIFRFRMRDEETFSSVEQLERQLALDEKKTRELLS
ncbi:MAG: bifunctional riboflavin kinase/FAD synthetase [Bacteroidales bacterium]|jgi:riboflavin kinase/FMN adenylyltransferase